jgi:hypothetical protein
MKLLPNFDCKSVQDKGLHDIDDDSQVMFEDLIKRYSLRPLIYDVE